MNATTFARKLQDESVEHVSSLLANVFDTRANTIQAFADAVLTGLNGAETVRAHLVETTGQVLQDQVAAVARWSQVKTPGEAVELHQQLAREAWENSTARARSLGSLLWAAWDASSRPLTARSHELTRAAAE